MVDFPRMRFAGSAVAAALILAAPAVQAQTGFQPGQAPSLPNVFAPAPAANTAIPGTAGPAMESKAVQDQLQALAPQNLQASSLQQATAVLEMAKGKSSGEVAGLIVQAEALLKIAATPPATPVPVKPAP